MAEKLSARVDRLERLVEILAEKQEKIDDVLVLLTEAQIKTEERFRETDARFRETGERIDKLVSAIGELIRERNGGTRQS